MIEGTAYLCALRRRIAPGARATSTAVQVESKVELASAKNQDDSMVSANERADLRVVVVGGQTGR